MLVAGRSAAAECKTQVGNRESALFRACSNQSSNIPASNGRKHSEPARAVASPVHAAADSQLRSRARTTGGAGDGGEGGGGEQVSGFHVGRGRREPKSKTACNVPCLLQRLSSSVSLQVKSLGGRRRPDRMTNSRGRDTSNETRGVCASGMRDGLWRPLHTEANMSANNPIPPAPSCILCHQPDRRTARQPQPSKGRGTC